ncbi:transcription elongation factor spt5 [Cladophialophora chaetospira]|uniref:Transcription elongation factor SPT5 n=1 Tax=Cladophialophora chaetospira TaxID=386627 RepID=A0AA38X1K9_9EURO|nr:transcription elongation factor spt5 [Cladophialophora chaetospira]
MASGGSWLNQDFGGDDEESDNDFNPAVGAGSDAEDEGDQARQTKTAARRASEQDDDEDDPLPSLTKKSSSPVRRDRRPALDEEEEDQGDQDELADNGEDDEGEGEDLNGDEDDEEEEDEDDEDAVASRPRKRRRRGLNQFFEEEAEVDEDDDELEADEDDLGPDFIEPNHPDDDLPPEADQDDARHRELDRQRQLETSIDLEKQAAAYRERYGRRQNTSLNQGSFVPQNLLMPDVQDPSIWGVRCKQGKEREIVAKICKKMIESKGRNALKICSVFQRGDGEGPMAAYIFVEAVKKSDVDEALNGVADVYPRTKMNLVPIKEMPDLLRTRKEKQLLAGEYVRVKKGLYAGDLAVVDEIESNGLEVTLRLVPRLDYGLSEDFAKPPTADAKRKRPNTFAAPGLPKERPPQRLFNEVEAKKRHDRLLTKTNTLTRKSYVYNKETYEDGFLIKNYRLQHISTVDVNPKLEEITKLTVASDDGTETLDLEKLAHSLRTATAEGSYMPGDEVEVYEGEQRGIIGKTEAVKGNIVSIEVTEGELTGQIVEVPVKGLRKRFREGDNVKIIGGSKYRDEVGMVLRIKDDKVTVLTNNTNEEITVFSKDLREATDAGGGAAGNTQFDVQDLVQIDPTTVGVVIRADRESVRILDQNGSMMTRLPSQIQTAETRKNAVATDKNGSEIRLGDVVRESSGENKSGTILHIHRGYVFAHNKLGIENSGIWVNRCTNVVTTAAKGGRITNPSTDFSKMNPALLGKPAAAQMAPPQRPGRDPLQGKLVHINKGTYKGHRAIVKDTTAGEARLELQTKNKTINLNKFDLSIIDPNSQNRTRYEDWVKLRGGPMSMRSGPGIGGSRIPDGGFGGRTPMPAIDGMRTPAWGSSSRTPAWGGPGSGGSSGIDSGRTPSWKGPSGSQTSYSDAGGGMTSYGGAGNYSANTTGSRTPAWSSSAKTPYGAGGGDYNSSANSGFDAVSGSRTPAYNPSSSRTPAWGGPGSNAPVSAPTPGARPYDAPTPGMVSAPTPGARYDDEAYTPYLSAPTPGAGPQDAPTPAPPSFAKSANREPLKNNRLAPVFDAPTPAASAPTPYASGAFDAPTPAAGGPRYVDDDDDDE